MRAAVISLVTLTPLVLALPPINLGSKTFPSGYQFVAWDASISNKDACNNNVIITGSDGGPAPPICGTPFSIDGVNDLTLTCAEDGYTVTGINQGGVPIETCTLFDDEGTYCTDGVELGQEYKCA